MAVSVKGNPLLSQFNRDRRQAALGHGDYADHRGVFSAVVLEGSTRHEGIVERLPLAERPAFPDIGLRIDDVWQDHAMDGAVLIGPGDSCSPDHLDVRRLVGIVVDGDVCDADRRCRLRNG